MLVFGVIVGFALVAVLIVWRQSRIRAARRLEDKASDLVRFAGELDPALVVALASGHDTWPLIASILRTRLVANAPDPMVKYWTWSRKRGKCDTSGWILSPTLDEVQLLAALHAPVQDWLSRQRLPAEVTVICRVLWLITDGETERGPGFIVSTPDLDYYLMFDMKRVALRRKVLAGHVQAVTTSAAPALAAPAPVDKPVVVDDDWLIPPDPEVP